MLEWHASLGGRVGQNPHPSDLACDRRIGGSLGMHIWLGGSAGATDPSTQRRVVLSIAVTILCCGRACAGIDHRIGLGSWAGDSTSRRPGIALARAETRDG